ncbi:MAG: ATP-binding cassette domain-containing protein, partial [Alterinioella nitratireducens]|uniref:ATP-binding cassette domain-containing protein n=1 Tax=Alterinioella nitratireducens TaxID=2735915 RepID=UPI0040590A8F
MTAPVLEIDDLSVTFPIPKRGGWPWTKPDQLHAVSNATLSIAPGETLGLVGESGSGKSTLARA